MPSYEVISFPLALPTALYVDVGSEDTRVYAVANGVFVRKSYTMGASGRNSFLGYAATAVVNAVASSSWNPFVLRRRIKEHLNSAQVTPSTLSTEDVLAAMTEEELEDISVRTQSS